MNMRQRGLAILLAGLPLLGWAGPDRSPDETFYYDAAEGNIAEIEQGNLAHEKGQSQAVKDFGALMVHDHTAALDKLRSIAARKGIDLPSSAGVKGSATKGKLEILSGENFDKSYIHGMVKDHEKDIQAFESEAHNGNDPEAKAYAEATLPTLREHLKKIRAIAAAAGVSAA